ncbi:MAG: archaellin/type IV pilin N-terminal domain-containing protein [Candidatus Woesearchaeota archaeon]
MMNGKKGQTAMGTLIIFIALVLTAAVAAAVLISTISSLQSRALETGKATTQEVGTNLNVLDIYAERDSGATTVSNITIMLRLAAGSEAVRFDDMLFTIGLRDNSSDYQFNASTAPSTTTFNVTYAINGANPVDGYLTKGDVAKVELVAPRAVGEAENIRFGIIPKVGTPSYTETSTPDTIATQRVLIFP